MFDRASDGEDHREGDRVKGIFTSAVGLVIMALDEYFRRPDTSILRILTYGVVFVTGVLQFRAVDALDRSTRVQLGFFAGTGAVLLVAGLYAGSLPVWLMGLALVVVAWLVPRWYSESGGPVMPGPEGH